MGQQFEDRKPVSHVKNISKIQKHRQKDSKRIIGLKECWIPEIGIKIDGRNIERGTEGVIKWL